MGSAISSNKIVSIQGKAPEADITYFQPTYKLAWLIGSEHYENVKSTISGEPIYKNVTQSKKDIDQMQSLFFDLKFDEIITTIDAKCTKEMTDGYMKIYNRAKDKKF